VRVANRAEGSEIDFQALRLTLDRWHADRNAKRVMFGLELRNPRRASVSLSAPWGACIPSGEGSPSLYVAASGSATLAVVDAPAIVLEHGDIAFLPHGAAHRIASCAGVTNRPLSEYCAERDEYVVGGGGGAGTELRVMCFDFDRTQSRAILDYAPRTSILRARQLDTRGFICYHSVPSHHGSAPSTIKKRM
jgi:hypothetical protein